MRTLTGFPIPEKRPKYRSRAPNGRPADRERGKGSRWGTFLGVLVLGILNNLIRLMNVSPSLQGLVKGVIIVVAVLLQKKD